MLVNLNLNLNFNLNLTLTLSWSLLYPYLPYLICRQTVGLIIAGSLMTLSLIMLAYTACSDYVDVLDENRTLANRNYRNNIPGPPDRDNQQLHPSNSLYYQQVPTCVTDHTAYRGSETDHSRSNLGVGTRDGFLKSFWRGLTGSTDDYPANYYPGQTTNLGQHTQQRYGVELPQCNPAPAHTSYFPQPQHSGSMSGGRTPDQDPLYPRYQGQGQGQGQG